eukprot:7758378-Lingulodinium_polyedra.AAC.1
MRSSAGGAVGHAPQPLRTADDVVNVLGVGRQAIGHHHPPQPGLLAGGSAAPQQTARDGEALLHST